MSQNPQQAQIKRQLDQRFPDKQTAVKQRDDGTIVAGVRDPETGEVQTREIDPNNPRSQRSTVQGGGSGEADPERGNVSAGGRESRIDQGPTGGGTASPEPDQRNGDGGNGDAAADDEPVRAPSGPPEDGGEETGDGGTDPDEPEQAPTGEGQQPPGSQEDADRRRTPQPPDADDTPSGGVGDTVRSIVREAPGGKRAAALIGAGAPAAAAEPGPVGEIGLGTAAAGVIAAAAAKEGIERSNIDERIRDELPEFPTINRIPDSSSGTGQKQQEGEVPVAPPAQDVSEIEAGQPSQDATELVPGQPGQAESELEPSPPSTGQSELEPGDPAQQVPEIEPGTIDTGAAVDQPRVVGGVQEPSLPDTGERIDDTSFVGDFGVRPRRRTEQTTEPETGTGTGTETPPGAQPAVPTDPGEIATGVPGITADDIAAGRTEPDLPTDTDPTPDPVPEPEPPGDTGPEPAPEPPGDTGPEPAPEPAPSPVEPPTDTGPEPTTPPVDPPTDTGPGPTAPPVDPPTGTAPDPTPTPTQPPTDTTTPPESPPDLGNVPGIGSPTLSPPTTSPSTSTSTPPGFNFGAGDGTTDRSPPRPPDPPGLALFGAEAEMDSAGGRAPPEDEAPVVPGFASETIRDIALLGGGGGGDADLEEAAEPVDLLTGAVPTEEEVAGTEEEQEAIEETQSLFGLGDGDGGGLL